MVKIYFDTCSLHRPLDNRGQLRVALEAEAIIGIIAMVEQGTVEFVSSEILQLEVENNSQPQKKAYVLAILQLAKCVVLVDDEIEQRATFLEQSGFKAFDALHLASAEAAHVDFFCSCDD